MNVVLMTPQLSKNQLEFLFQILKDKREDLFSTDSVESRDRWIDALRSAAIPPS